MIRLSAIQAAQIEQRVTAGESVSVVASDFGLLDREVTEVVERVRTARAARPTGATPQPRPPVAPPQPPRDVDRYLEHRDKRIAKAATAAHKALGILFDLVKAWDDAEADRQRQERERTEAAAAVERLERQLAEARDKLRAAKGSKGAGAGPKSGPTSAEIRAWAAEQGMEVPAVGQVRSELREAYLEAHAQEASA